MPIDTPASLRLAFGFSFEDLYSREGLVKLDERGLALRIKD